MILYRIMCGLFAACFAIVLLTDGGVYPLSQSLATMLMALVLAGAALFRPWPHGRAWPLVSCLILWGLLVLWVSLQTTVLPGEILSSPAWSVLRQNIGVPEALSQGRISVTPGDTRFAILPISLPFLTFMAALLLFPADRQAMRVWEIIAVAGGLLAIFAVAQTVLFPEMLMFSRKEAYLGSLTAPFVNRNTAATFYGVIALIQLCEVIRALQASGARRSMPYGRREGGVFPFDRAVFDQGGDEGRTGQNGQNGAIGQHGQNRQNTRPFMAALARLSSPAPSSPERRATFFLALALPSLVALALTQSRGGALSALAGFVILAVAAVMTWAGRDGRGAPGGSRRGVTSGRNAFSSLRMWLHRHPRVGAVIVFFAVVSVTFVFLARAISRAERQGNLDSRICIFDGIADAIGTNWLQGMGAGAFRYAFAAYRPSECGVAGVWFRAHDLYLDAALALGLPVAILATGTVFVLLACVLRRGLVERRRQRPVVVAALAVTVLVALHSLFDFSLQISGFAILYALIAALATNVSLCKQSKILKYGEK